MCDGVTREDYNISAYNSERVEREREREGKGKDRSERGVGRDPEGGWKRRWRTRCSFYLVVVCICFSFSQRQHPLSRPRKPEGVRACQRVLSPPPFDPSR